MIAHTIAQWEPLNKTCLSRRYVPPFRLTCPNQARSAQNNGYIFNKCIKTKQIASSPGKHVAVKNGGEGEFACGL